VLEHPLEWVSSTSAEQSASLHLPDLPGQTWHRKATFHTLLCEVRHEFCRLLHHFRNAPPRTGGSSLLPNQRQTAGTGAAFIVGSRLAAFPALSAVRQLAGCVASQAHGVMEGVPFFARPAFSVKARLRSLSSRSGMGMFTGHTS